jgi:hypothetical protein
MYTGEDFDFLLAVRDLSLIQEIAQVAAAVILADLLTGEHADAHAPAMGYVHRIVDFHDSLSSQGPWRQSWPKRSQSV